MFYRLTRFDAAIPWHAWFLALRPKTLPLSLSPVFLGTAAAYAAQGFVVWQPFFIALITAALIQIGTNLFNDVADFEKGTDSPTRVGPPRAVANGWLSPKEVKSAAWLAFFLAFLGGAALVYYAGAVILIIGVLSLLSGWGYTCGPAPIAYRPLGEIFVWIFFGIVAVCGSFYLQTFDFAAEIFFAAALTGCHAAAVMTVNNYRDAQDDFLHGKNTLAVFLGRRLTRLLFVAEILLPFALLPFFYEFLGAPAFLPFLTLPAALLAITRFFKHSGAKLNHLLAFTARLQFAFAMLLAAAFCF